MTTSHPQPAWATTADHVQTKALAADEDSSRAADRALIAERVHRYGWGYDERNRSQLAECFTTDGQWEANIMGVDRIGPFEGRDAVVDFLTEFWAEQTDQRRHIFTNVIVDDLAGDGAVAHAYLTLTATADATLQTVTNGPYRFTMQRDEGVWRIAHLYAGFDAPF